MVHVPPLYWWTACAGGPRPSAGPKIALRMPSLYCDGTDLCVGLSVGRGYRAQPPAIAFLGDGFAAPVSFLPRCRSPAADGLDARALRHRPPRMGFEGGAPAPVRLKAHRLRLPARPVRPRPLLAPDSICASQRIYSTFAAIMMGTGILTKGNSGNSSAGLVAGVYLVVRPPIPRPSSRRSDRYLRRRVGDRTLMVSRPRTRSADRNSCNGQLAK